jgi:predicted Zn finger-like uncharacterized protein
MILTCPECATGYFVDDAQIKSSGRAVRCASCGARWTARPPAPPEPNGAADEMLSNRSSDAPADSAQPITGDDLPKAFRDRAEEGRRMRKAAIAGASWMGALVLLAILVGALALFRTDVVRVWPPTASLYAAVGLPVNALGLTIEQVRAEPSLQDGHAALAVSGFIRNVAGRSVVAPPLRISLMNAQGKRVAGQIAVLANARVPPGETRRFITAILDPPFSAQTLQVEFATGAGGRPGAPAVAAPAGPMPPPSFSLRGANSDVAADANAADAANAAPVNSASVDAAPANAASPER